MIDQESFSKLSANQVYRMFVEHDRRIRSLELRLDDRFKPDESDIEPDMKDWDYPKTPNDYIHKK